MSRPISTAMLAHLAQSVTTLCTCIRLTRLDGKTFALTDLDMDITIGGQTYSTAIGYSRTAINTDSAMTVSNANFLGVFDSASLTATDLRSGLFDYASLEVLAVNWADPTMAPIVLPGAVLGEVSAQPSGIFTAELRGISQFLANQIGELYTSACKASLGDWRCKVPLSDPSWTKTGAVVTVAGDNRVFTIGDLGEPRDGDSTWWTAGTVTWTSGANDGRSMEVGSWGVLTRTIGLFMPMPSPIAIGDAFRVTPGCDKSRTMCKTRYNNVINIRATPDIPGNAVLLRVPAAGGATASGGVNPFAGSPAAGDSGGGGGGE
jgi:uncharacterized phage protein (TIGR02218 family)